MSTARAPHELRTSEEPRQNRLYKVRLSKIVQANSDVRLLQLAVGPSGCEDTGAQQNDYEPNRAWSQPLFQFLPGQWLDVYLPSIPQAGGFTITSTPKDALPPRRGRSSNAVVEEPYVELAIQKSLSSPPAAWFWQPRDAILGQEFEVRVGGRFIWPPPNIPLEEIGRAVFVAGGVGINPLISMLAHIFQNPWTLPHSSTVNLLYSTRLPTTPKEGEDISNHLDQILFFPRLRNILNSQRHLRQQQREQTPVFHLHLYITNLPNTPYVPPEDISLHNYRITMADLHKVIRGEQTAAGNEYSSRGERTVCYICGPPGMTDEFVAGAEEIIGTGEEGEKRIFYEKWW
ncbi:uncharacterized protein PADG_01580 [Paracoccidioides brasiliensis Pb18]|uniref:FAD-binding FR-type domain-containing protein n=2 Tax=Paracoccidioides brasiliensis TaxID=121759 RepID=C1G3R4_PARBD|nr:uncharacterized protein PADG_01580 [Paracoccidioides brasiliensis Pb18]EEH45430.1 hypothetical protein PADG_01580 [Paracoccidioides brasiliensis Pb18]ODH43344.1 hypothetical protein ACO22_01064 [Paracoccidioides brasiliensis]ODH50228.1 hypothetical protein GX48_03650 [Paracoccidioides brasiliensis]